MTEVLLFGVVADRALFSEADDRDYQYEWPKFGRVGMGKDGH